MPLDSSTYALSSLRVDGRRWNELRRLHAQIGIQQSSEGSSVVEMGNTKVLCTVHGPRQASRSGGGGQRDQAAQANIECSITLAGFAGVERKRRGRNDKRVLEMQHTLVTAFGGLVFGGLFPHSTITIAVHVLAQDGSLLAACLNAATLALIDAGIPMRDYLAACTCASAPVDVDDGGVADPLLDVNGQEELELPFLTAATSGGEGKVDVLMLETKVPGARLEGMLAVALDGCAQVRRVLDAVVRERGKRLLEGKGG